MIRLLHGDNLEASRQALNELREQARGKEVRQLDGKSLTETLLIQALESSSLFGGDVLVIIENLLGSLGKNPKRLTTLTLILTKSAVNSDVIIWESRELGKTVIEHLGKRVNAQLFKTPVLIFQLLDGLRPGNTKLLLPLLEKVLERQAPELLLLLLGRRVRQLIMLADKIVPDGLQPWQAGRLTSQAKSFTMDKLISMYKNLLEIEYAIKTGASPFSLSQQIEQWLISL